MRRSWQIGAVYVGSVIGAGFSSGQELHFFFAQHGQAGLLAFVAAVGMFFLGGILVLGQAQRWATTSHSELLHNLLGPYAAGLIDYALTAIAFIVLAIMLAAAGTLGQTLYNIPFTYGTWGMAIISREILRGDSRRFLRFNGVFVIILLALTCYVVVPLIPWASLWASTATTGAAASWRWWGGAALYPAYNIALALPALAALGTQIDNARQAYGGAVLGSFCLGVAGFILLLALGSTPPNWPSELPLVELVAARTSVAMARVYGIALLLAIVTSCVSGAYGLGRRLQRFNPVPGSYWANASPYRPDLARRQWIASVLPLIAAPISYIGFANLVQNVYPIVGYIGLFTLAMAGAASITHWLSDRPAGP